MFHHDLQLQYDQVKNNKPLSPTQVSKAISLQLQRAKMPKELKPYTLKHIGVSKAGQHGIDKQTINEHARWTTDSIMFDKRKKLKSKQKAKMKINFQVRAVKMRGPVDQNTLL
ncbi:MAG: hypothetical protein EZS28_054843 [Streblomastix strix]|uniref:Uncharacterized protein n=1 Tax=Streblomastix strix TaxID=222440 RepID=A0A5J4QCI6_9EUKA|nr:MAG: hypothetical protein EZS28_054843 [Streblomastix strix]